MTPKDKAKELFDKYWIFFVHSDATHIHLLTKQCALIAVDEILEQCVDANFGGFSLYWQEVKQEIEKL
jgi:hypothetical protein